MTEEQKHVGKNQDERRKRQEINATLADSVQSEKPRAWLHHRDLGGVNSSLFAGFGLDFRRHAAFRHDTDALFD